MERINEEIYTDSEGKKVYGVGHQKTPEERDRLLEEQQKLEHAHALELSSTKAIPTPDGWKEKDKRNKVIQFPNKRVA